MKKKMWGALLAAALLAAQTMTALAASPVAQPTITGDAANYYTVNSVDTTGVDAANTALIQDINSGAKEISALAEAAPDLSGILSGKTMVTKIFDVDKVGNPEMVSLDGVQYHKVPMNISNLTRSMTEIHVLHYSVASQAWEDIKNEVDYDNKVITGYFKDLSPVVIIAKVADSEGGSSSSGSGSDSDSGSGSGSTAGTESTGSTGAVSPKTGVASDWALWAVASVILMGAAGTVYKRARR